jgi:hypothetical protein
MRVLLVTRTPLRCKILSFFFCPFHIVVDLHFLRVVVKDGGCVKCFLIDWSMWRKFFFFVSVTRFFLSLFSVCYLCLWKEHRFFVKRIIRFCYCILF